MVVANVNSQSISNSSSENTVRLESIKPGSTFEISSSQGEQIKVNNDKKSYTITFPSLKCTDEIKLENMNANSIVVSQSMNVTPHMKVNYRGSQQSPSDVYLSGNDHVGKLTSNFLNSHPQLLIKYLQEGNIFDNSLTTQQLR